MPRKQLDILRDLFIAHRDKDEFLYFETAREYIKYMRWKGFYNKADEFEVIINPTKKESRKSLDNQEQRVLFADVPKQEKQKKKKKSSVTWQVARGSEINFIQIHRLLEYLTRQLKSSYSHNELKDILGYSLKKTQGFSRLLFFLALLEKKTLKPTQLALLIHKHDSYFEDIGTLWFLHYQISSQTNLIIWNRIANHLMTKSIFTFQDAMSLFDDQKTTHSAYSFNHHLRKEFNVCTRAYLDSEFNRLSILQSLKKDEFKRTKTTSVPDGILLASILFFKQKHFINDVTLEIKSLINEDNSPGKLCYLKEFKLREALERLRISGFITIESFANLDQIKFVKKIEFLECLDMYYQNKFNV